MKSLRLSLTIAVLFIAVGCSDDETSTTNTTMDTGMTATDMGTDTTTTPVDTGTTPMDTGTAPLDTGTTPTDTGGDTGAMATTHKVQVGAGGGNTFAPANVTIKAGDSVEWEWMGVAHSVTEATNGTACTTKSGGFDSGIQNTGHKFTQKFTTAGTVHYICTPHCTLGMRGTITVTP